MPDHAGTGAGLSARRVDLVLGTSLGGVGRHVRSLVVDLVARNARVVVHGPVATEETFRFSQVGAAFRPLDIRVGMAPVPAWRAARQLRHELTGSALVHAHGIRAGLVTATAVRRSTGKARPPLLVTWHNIPMDAQRWLRVQRRLEARLAQAAAVNLVVSPDLADRVRRLGGRDVRLHPVGSSPLPTPSRSRDDLRAELDAGDRPVLFALGRLHRQKGFDLLVEAAARWRERSPQPLVVIAGDGPDRDGLARTASRQHLDIRWLGYVADRTRIAELFCAADLVVVPSRWEGSPLAVHEALSAGRPVVATPVGGLPALVGSDEVVFVPPDDPAALAAAVSRLLDQPDETAAVAGAGRRAVARWPDERAAAAAVAQVYAEVLHP